MANEYKLPYTAAEIDEKLGKIDGLPTQESVEMTVDKMKTDLIVSGGVGHTETETVIVVAETAVNFEDNEGLYIGGVSFGNNLKLNEEALEYPFIICWDGIDYRCEFVEFEGGMYLGNLGLVGQVDTGEPFVCMVSPEGIEFATADTSATHTIQVSALTKETVHIIAPKYLPEGIGYGEVKSIFSGDVVEHVYEGASIGLTENVEYTVTYNNTVYECTCSVFQDDEMTGYYMGNTAALGGADNGIPFFIIDMPDQNELAIQAMDEGTIHVTIEVDNAHRIDGKYLPKGGVGYTEITMGEILPETVVTTQQFGNFYNGELQAIGLVEGSTYVVTYNGQEYSIAATAWTDDTNGATAIMLGDIEAFMSGTGDTPFVIGEQDGAVAFFCVEANATISIKGCKEIVHTIDSKYLPKSDSTSYGGTELLHLYGLSKDTTVEHNSIGLEVGREYVILCNDEQFIEVCQEYLPNVNFLGNPIALDGDDNGMPFVIIDEPSGDICTCRGFSEVDCEITVFESVTRIGKEGLPIDVVYQHSLNSTFDKLVEDKVIGRELSGSRGVASESYDFAGVEESIKPFEIKEGLTYRVTVNSNEYVCTPRNHDGTLYLGVWHEHLEENEEYPFCVVSNSQWAYFSTSIVDEGNIYIDIIEEGTRVDTIDAKFIPAMDSIILNSSTEGSIKKFRITVDDNGTISAIEIETKVMITFYVDILDEKEAHEAEKGMTWGEWLNSEYNRRYFELTTNDEIHGCEDLRAQATIDDVAVDDVIIGNHVYTTTYVD